MLVLENTATDRLCYSFMGERLTFGTHTPERPRQTKADRPATMFPDGEDLPLFSGTPIPAIVRPFVPEDLSFKQGMLPGMPAVDYAHVLEHDRALRRRRTAVVLPPSDDIFTAAATMGSSPSEPASEPVEQRGEIAALPVVTPDQSSPRNRTEKLHPLREALAPYLDFPTLRRLA